MSFATTYQPQRPFKSQQMVLRGLRHHVLTWGEAAMASADRAPLVMLHGWMDVGASFQFVVDELPPDRFVVALDWRGFGLSERTASDSYWFPDYLADLDALLDAMFPAQAVDLLGHSMGGNVAMIYAGVRPARVRRLVNLEGFGMPQTDPARAPANYAKWLDELKQPAALRSYESVEAVARRLQQTNPRLSAARASWLAQQWSRLHDDGTWHILADAAHKRRNPVLYQATEVLECWKRIKAPVLWVEGDLTNVDQWWGDRYPRSEFEARLAVVPRLERERLSPAGHMVHHDQPEALARRLDAFLRG